ncbi:ATP-binding protein [Tropicimonas sp. IMCC34043]|uniref:ATP-binding protein n=1 Tax=Tropicimonas sp. IMCC34043 TaxID=2248760 RepID=UPI000E268324|nr:ATP-binding protein [Tropicimonas sp. IMCC34043]
MSFPPASDGMLPVGREEEPQGEARAPGRRRKAAARRKPELAGFAPGPRGPSLRERLGNRPEEVRAALARVIRALDAFGLGVEDQGNVEIVLAEVLNNVVEHALPQAPDGWLTLQLDLLPDRIAARVVDTGGPMPGLVVPPGQPQNLDVALDALPEGGFGWFLIRHLTCELEYVRTADGNELGFWIPRGAAL